MGALLKLASTEGLNAPELVFYRSLFSLPVVLFWVLRRESLASLRPNRPLAHAKVEEFVTPQAFDAYAAIARAKGFLLVAASPLTRSS